MERALERNQLAIRAAAVAIRQLHVAVDILNRRLGRPDEAVQVALDHAVQQLERAHL